MSHAGSVLQIARQRAALTPQVLAKRLGYANADTGARRISGLERGEGKNPWLAARLCATLGIDPAAFASATEQDDEDRMARFQAWVNLPVPPQLVERLMPAVYRGIPIPEELTTHEDIEAFACAVARKAKRGLCLQLNRRHTVWIDEKGDVTGRAEATVGDAPAQLRLLIR